VAKNTLTRDASSGVKIGGTFNSVGKGRKGGLGGQIKWGREGVISKKRQKKKFLCGKRCWDGETGQKKRHHWQRGRGMDGGEGGRFSRERGGLEIIKREG